MRIPRCDIDGVGEGGSDLNFKATQTERQRKTEENVDGRPVGARRAGVRWKRKETAVGISLRECAYVDMWEWDVLNVFL